jgi:YceI-like domain
VRTARKGAAAKAGHDLVIEVTSWSATLTIGDEPAQSSLELDADAGSLKVRDGTGGVMELGDDDRREIEQNIDDEVLGRHPIEFRSTGIEGDGERLRVRGDLTLAQRSHPVQFDLSLGPDRAIAGSATLKQSDWGIKPYTALFGALKVADEVEVEVEGEARD